jgi:transketolase
MKPTISSASTPHHGAGDDGAGYARHAGRPGKMFGMHSFGMSARVAAVAQRFGFSPDRVIETAMQAMAAG